MAGRTKRGGPEKAATAETAAGMLRDAIEKGCDFVLTFGEGNEGMKCLHLMTGSLITPCMLGTLSNRCELSGPGGCHHVTIPCDTKRKSKKSR